MIKSMSQVINFSLLFILSIVPALLAGSTLHIEQKFSMVIIGWLLMLLCAGIYRFYYRKSDYFYCCSFMVFKPLHLTVFIVNMIFPFHHQ